MSSGLSRRRKGYAVALIGGVIVAGLILCIAWNDATRWGYGSNSQLTIASRIPAVIAGRTAAYRDLARGDLRLLGYGSPRPAHGVYAELLKARLGIELQEMAGCIVSDHQWARWGTYNSVMLRTIDRRFGLATLARLLVESEHVYETRRLSRRPAPGAKGI